ncbi:caspase, EACC1-associated type [Streptomyces sp. NPDC004285]
MTELPDPSQSAAVLIGTSRYEWLPQLPAVSRNVGDLADVFQDPALWGLPGAHTRVVVDPGIPADLLDPVYEAGERATDTLLVYYCGHGLRDSETADLYLGLSGSRDGIGYTAVAYGHLRAAIRASAARRKIVVLDCCFSGRAARSLGDEQRIAALAGIEGAYVLAASPRDHVALAPEGEKYTAFTGELLDVLRQGLPDAPDTLDLETLFQALDSRLNAKNRPRPQRSQENNIGRLPLVRNRARASRASVHGPVADADVRAAMVSTGLQVARLMRSNGRIRDALPILRMILQEQRGETDGDTYFVQLELAEVLTETGQEREAVEILERAFQQTHKRFGPEAAMICRRLAELLQAAGNHAQACEVLRHALDALEGGERPPAAAS